MRKAGPILILIIGVLALIIDFVPGLTVPDSATPAAARSRRSSGWTCRAGSGSSTRRSRSATGRPRPEDLEVIREIIENRVNATGVVGAASITTQGSDRIVIELPGVSDPNVDPAAGRPDGPPGLRAARPDDEEQGRHGRRDAVPAAVLGRAAGRRPRSARNSTANSASSRSR